ncbi:MAG: leucine-rich repeat domain-containing protein [Treponema sp.]|jgi:hypothetical protein|nr:leucine-rich repeat domain-containing protein [Treponema sp.]
MKKTILFFVVALAAMVSLHAQTVPNGLLYANEGNGVKITGYNGTATTLVIPASIGGRNVTIIGAGAFMNNETLESVTLPNTVTTIEDAAFAFSVLKSITLSSSLTIIGGSAFRGSPLASVIIPASVTTIEGSAFQNTALKSVIIPAAVTSIGTCAFETNTLTSVTMSRSTQLGMDVFLPTVTITYR